MSEAEAKTRLELEHEFLDSAKAFNWDTVKGMLKETPDLVNVQPAGRWSALHQAAFEGNAAIATFLIEQGASLNAKTRGGKTPADVAKKAEVKAMLKETEEETKEEDTAAGEAAAGEEDAAPPTKKAKKGPRFKMNVNNAVDKEYEDSSFAEIASAPVSALQGIAAKGQDVLKRFKVKTVRDLGTWKYYKVAKAIAGLAALEQEGKRSEASILNINKAVDKKYEPKSLREILSLPPSALQGLAPWADEALATIHVTTIAKLGEWKFARWAEWIVELANYENDDMSSK